jgi:hypothetical protein
VSSAITQLFHGFEHKFDACNNTNSSTSSQRHALSTSLCSLSPLKHVPCKNSPLWSEMHSDLMKKTYILNVFFLYIKTYTLNINLNLNQCVIRGFGVYKRWKFATSIPQMEGTTLPWAEFSKILVQALHTPIEYLVHSSLESKRRSIPQLST